MQDERPLNLETFELDLDKHDTEANRRMFELLSNAIGPPKVSLVKQRPFAEVARELVEKYRSGEYPDDWRRTPEYSYDPSVGAGIEYVGQIGNFLAYSPRELQGERELYAAPDTAERLRTAYDLDIVESPFMDEGTVFVFDQKAIKEALDGPFPLREPGRYPFLEAPLFDPKNIVKIAGI